MKNMLIFNIYYGASKNIIAPLPRNLLSNISSYFQKHICKMLRNINDT